MKKILVLGLAGMLFTACQQGPARYSNSSPEINVFKAHIKDYNEGNWESWTAHYSDTAKVYHNTLDASGPIELLEGLKTNLEAASSYSFVDKDIFYEMVIDDEDEKWVNFWGTWEGTIAENGKKLTIPVHLTVQFIDDKIVEEHAYYDMSGFMSNMQEIEAKNTMPADQKIIDQKLDDFVNKFHNKQDLSVLDNILAKGYSRYMNGLKVASNAKELGEVFSNSFIRGFPDMEITNSERIYMGNKVYIHWNFKGTNTGEFNEAAPTGNKVDISGLSEVHFNSDGKLYLEKVFFNELDLINQLSNNVASTNK